MNSFLCFVLIGLECTDGAQGIIWEVMANKLNERLDDNLGRHLGRFLSLSQETRFREELNLSQVG